MRLKIEFSWRAGFLGFYLTPGRDQLWICLVPFLPLYVRLKKKSLKPSANPPTTFP